MMVIDKSKTIMRYRLTGRWGKSYDNATIEQMRQALAELDVEDKEHPDTALTHEDGWCLGAYTNGLLIWEHVELNEPRHMRDVPRERVLELWLKLVGGEFASIDAEPWKPGYGKNLWE